MGSLQAIMGFATPIFNVIYISTLPYYVGTVYLVIAGVFALLFALLAYTYCFLRGGHSKETVDLVSVTKTNTL